MLDSHFSYTVEKAEAEPSVKDFLRHCIDVPKFLACCQACPNYAHRWSCPPFSFNPMDVWNAYTSLRLYARFLIPGNADGHALMGALRKEKPGFLQELLRLEQDTPDSLALACGTCDACNVCAKESGRPCAHPEQLRYSIEALGGDVGEAAQRSFGKPLLWVHNGEAPEYLMLVGGLLTR